MSAPGLQGLRPWIIQRITAAFIAIFIVYLAVSFFSGNSFDYATWYMWMAWPGHNISMGLFIIAVLWHAWIGIRDVILDYVHPVVLRVLLFTVVMSILIGSGLWGLRVLFLVAIK